jgi:hypothetical protein
MNTVVEECTKPPFVNIDTVVLEVINFVRPNKRKGQDWNRDGLNHGSRDFFSLHVI